MNRNLLQRAEEKLSGRKETEKCAPDALKLDGRALTASNATSETGCSVSQYGNGPPPRTTATTCKYAVALFLTNRNKSHRKIQLQAVRQISDDTLFT